MHQFVPWLVAASAKVNLALLDNQQFVLVTKGMFEAVAIKKGKEGQPVRARSSAHMPQKFAGMMFRRKWHNVLQD